MSAVIHPQPTLTGPVPRLWSRDEYYRMAEAGILKPDERVELIDGEVIQKVSPMRSPHATGIGKACEALDRAYRDNAFVRVQLPLAIAQTSEPEPDLAVVRGTPDDYGADHPGPADVLLVVEVADTSLAFDRTTKRILYGAAGIVEYWIVNLAARTLEVYRLTTEQGYAEVTPYDETQLVAALTAPESPVPVADLLPKHRTNTTERETQ